MSTRTPEEFEEARWSAPTTVAETPARSVTAVMILILGGAIVIAALIGLALSGFDRGRLWIVVLTGVAWILTGWACLHRRWWLSFACAAVALVIGAIAATWT